MVVKSFIFGILLTSLKNNKDMKIILIAGKPNTGKSTTLNILYDKLTDKGARNIIEKRKPVGNKKENDFQCVINWNGKSVAIFSMGDILRDIINAIIQYAHCDIIILAYNTSFSTKLDVVIEKKNNHCVIKKRAPTDADCNVVIGNIMKYL